MRVGPHRPIRLGINEPCVWGVHLGGCVERTGRFDDALHIIAHAHVATRDPWRGWICLVHPEEALTASSKPSQTLLHEVAHLMVGTMKHDAEWRDTLREIGGAAEARRYFRRR